jgi:flagella basal body P-ring formation protein FlgA
MIKVSTFRRRPGNSAWRVLVAVAVLAASAPALRAAVSNPESLAAIRATAEDFVRRQVPPSALRVHIRAEELDARLRLEHCTTPLNASLAMGAELHARTAVKVSCASSPLWSVFVPVTLESEVTVLVLRESAARGARLSAAQVAAETRRVSGLPAAYISDVEVLARHTLTRPLTAGAVLTADALLPDYIIHQGQQVTLVAAGAGIEVRASGKALEDAREGGRVRVQNLASLKVVQGVVSPTGTIEITP